VKKKRKGSHVVFSFVFLVLGFIIAFAYQIAREDKEKPKISDSQFERDLALRNELIAQEEKNNQLEQQLKKAQTKLVSYEKKLSNEAKTFSDLANEATDYRMYVGKIPVKGSGISVTLEDGDYIANKENANNYLVHEHHVLQVVNELYVSGAEAVSINGQRLSHHSYIVCNGPVIEIDGYQHPAPFVITAIGNYDALASALNIAGGVKDLLVNENVKFTLEKKTGIRMNALIGG